MEKQLLKIKQMLLIVFAMTLSINVYASDETNCLSPQAFAKQMGNVDGGKFLKPCSEQLIGYDHRFISWSKMTLTQSDIEEQREFLTKKSLKVDEVKPHLSEQLFLWGFTAIEVWGFVVFLLAAFGFSVIGVVNKDKKNNTAFTSAMVSICFALVLLTAASSSSIRVRAVYYPTAIVNDFLISQHNVEYLNNLNDDFLSTLTSETATSTNKKLSKAFHQHMLERKVFESWVYQNEFGSSSQYHNNAWTKFGKIKPTGQQAIDISSECLSTHQAVMDYNTEINLTGILDLDVATQLPEAITIRSGGATANYECETKYFGRKLDSLSIRADFANILTRFFEQKFQSDMSESTSLTTDFKSTFNASLGEAQKIFEKVSENGSNANLQAEGLLMQSYAAVKSANETRTNIKQTDQYEKVVKQFEGLLGDEILFKNADFSVAEALTSMRNAGEAFKFSFLGGYCHGEDEITGECLSGFQPIEKWIGDTATLFLNEQTSLKTSDHEFALMLEHATEFNNSDLSKPNRHYSLTMTNGHHLDAFELKNIAGKHSILTAKADGSKSEELRLDVIDRELAFETLLNAIDDAVYRKAAQNHSEFVEELVGEILNDIRPTIHSVFSFDQKMIDVNKEMSQILNAYQDIYSIEQRSWDVSKPQTYFPYDLRIFDVDEDKIELFNTSESLRFYDASYLLDEIPVAERTQTTSDEATLDDLIGAIGISEKLKESLMFGQCPVRTADNRCDMNLIQQVNQNKDPATTWTVIFGALGLGLEAFQTIKSGASSVLSVGKGSSIFGDAIALLGGALNAGLDTMIDTLQGPIGFAFAVMLIITIALYAIGYIGLLLGIKYLIYPIKEVSIRLIMLVWTFVVEVISNIFKLGAGENAGFDKTTTALKDLFFVFAFFPIEIVYITTILTSSSIGGAIHELVFATANDDLMSQAFHGFLFVCILIGVVIYAVSSIDHIRNTGRTALNLRTTPDDNDLNFATAYLGAQSFSNLKNGLGSFSKSITERYKPKPEDKKGSGKDKDKSKNTEKTIEK
ncbi:hypothetical protein [Vibrio atypicus]|uniref:hypothetical protein n=1 Tax=Vibrio atypicus TaxID=558271 RepID=UPI0013575547|nr:hypothetical protein [Vibrio atypicus]